ncbi:MAG: hypothetical protein JO161_10865 [Planctomycetaceae bacterium]|nr:hypothetical protein [Planctomycetaceae bacterium]
MAKTAKKAKTTKTKKRTTKRAKKTTAKKAVAHREGTIRSQLEGLYKKHGYKDAKVAALKKGLNKFTVQKQLYLIHTGQ